MRAARWLLASACVAGLLYVFPEPILRPVGEYLVSAREPVRSDCLFVLAGDFHGQRILKAVELYRAGMAPKLLVSGPAGLYGQTEDQLAIAYARSHGGGDVPYIPLPHKADSTVTEARAVLGELRRNGCGSVLVVTSDFHTRRAGNILSREWPGITVHMAAAPTDTFDAQSWWRKRMYQKTVFFEWSKTFADWIGL